MLDSLAAEERKHNEIHLFAFNFGDSLCFHCTYTAYASLKIMSALIRINYQANISKWMHLCGGLMGVGLGIYLFSLFLIKIFPENYNVFDVCFLIALIFQLKYNNNFN